MQFLFRNVWIAVEQKNPEAEKNIFLEELFLIYLKIFIIYNL
jgi:hypothetical protein